MIVGGRARRMGGHPKCLIEIDGAPLLARLAGLLAPRCEIVRLIGDPQGPYAATGWPMLPDVIADRGPAGGLYTALKAAGDGWVFALAGDLPALDAATLDGLWAAREGAEVVLYHAEGRLQTLVGLWRAALHAPLGEALLEGGISLHGFARRRALRVLEGAAARPFTNINTFEGLADFLGRGEVG